MTKARHLFNRCSLAVILGFAAAAGNIQLVRASLVPPRSLHEHSFRLARPEDHLLEVTERQPLSLAGYAYGDFDLYAEVELPEGGELDLVFRLVEPWRREDGSMPGFHGRFSLLRMSAVREGPVYLSRDQALFAATAQGGQLLAPGVIASIHLKARGRWVRANIAGVQHPWYETSDDRGGLAMVVRGGVSVVHSFEIAVIERGSLHLWLYAGIVGSLAALLLIVFGVSLARLLPSLVCLPLVAFLAGSLVLSRLLPAIEPSQGALLCASLSGLPLAIVLALRCRRSCLEIGLIAPVGIWIVVLLQEGDLRLRSADDPRLSQHFGRDSGIAPRDALCKQLHARAKVHRLGFRGTPVFFLGGGNLFEPWPRNEHRAVAYLPMQIESTLREALGREIEAVVQPTQHADARQQLLLFERFYQRDYRPAVVVFAVSKEEQQRGRERLRGTLDLLAELAAAKGFRVLLLESEVLPPVYTETLEGVGKARGWPLVRGLLATEPSSRLVSELSQELVRLLR